MAERLVGRSVVSLRKKAYHFFNACQTAAGNSSSALKVIRRRQAGRATENQATRPDRARSVRNGRKKSAQMRMMTEMTTIKVAIIMTSHLVNIS